MPSTERRWILIRDATVFTAKAGIEALRDVVLIPVGLGSALIGLLVHPDDPERYFRQMLAVGQRFDHYLNLFGERDEDKPQVDALFERIETVLVEQHQQGGITAGAKHAIDRTLDAVHRARPGSAGAPRPPGDSSARD